MDLWLIGRHDLANLLFNRYVSAFSRTLPDMPARLATAMRPCPSSWPCAPRSAPISPLRRRIPASRVRDAEHKQEARAYFALAEDLLAPRPQMLVAIGGFSGSGKSTMTRLAGRATSVAAGRADAELRSHAQGHAQDQAGRPSAALSL